MHPTAQVSAGATLEDGVEVGPFCCVGEGVRLGAGTRLLSHAVIEGPTVLGVENEVHPFAVLGGAPQDRSYQGEATRLEVGDRNVFREHVTVHRGTSKDQGVTRIGSGGLFMAGCHVAHDARVGDGVTLANGTLLGGHVRVHSRAALSGAVAVHHWVTIGGWSFVAGLSRVLHDVPPFMLCEGSPARPRCINVVALRRGGFAQPTIEAISEAYRLLYRAKVGVEPAREILRSQAMLVPPVEELLEFLEHQQQGRHGRARERRKAA